MTATGQVFSVGIQMVPSRPQESSISPPSGTFGTWSRGPWFPSRPIVLDLAQVTFMDTGAIHWLVEVCDATGHPVVLRNVSPVVRRIF
jgi:hypothetical protein